MAKRDIDDDRPKRSWREVDKMRDKGGSARQRQEDRAQERLQRSPVYEQYKAKVSKLLGGEDLPDMVREKLDPSGALKARDDLLKKIKKVATEDRKAWAEAVTEFVDKFDMPEDAYLLVDLLDHPKDRVVEKSLDQLEVLAKAGALTGSKCPKSIDQRLRSLEMMGSDPDVQAKAKGLREKLRG
ncbi:MAG: hypothetical protein HY901_22405 [Deltaproteobacteria bacterium]|nr:hypothetical protein [Deltaproteobacteria bacterium]